MAGNENFKNLANTIKNYQQIGTSVISFNLINV